MSADLSYLITGGFIRFVANTAAGESAWREMAKHSDGSGAFLAHLAPSILAQLRAAGYSVAKAKRSQRQLRNRFSDEDLALLESLAN